MKYLLTVLVVVACLFAVAECCQKKAPKAIKSLRRLCKNSLNDAFVIEDGNFTEVFEDLNEWCPDFMTNYSQYFTNKAKEDKPYNPIKELKKVCAYYERKYGDGETLPILEGLGDLCYDFEYAFNVSEGIIVPSPPPTEMPVKEPLEIQQLQLMCKKAEKGRLRWKLPRYNDCLILLRDDFCPDYMDAVDDGAVWPYDRSMKGRKYIAEQEIEDICSFVKSQLGYFIPEGHVLDGLDDVCRKLPYLPIVTRNS